MKIVNILLISALSIKAFSLEDVYTVSEAQQCFYSKALQNCESIINECLANEQCQRQLHFFHDCSFQQTYNDQVFNGNCFKNWKNTAIQSRQVISCLDSHCNLTQYNSEVSLPVLYSCSTQALLNQQTECNQKCQQSLSKHVSQNLPYKPIREIYQLTSDIKAKINDQNAEKIIELIRKQCIEQDGQIRRRHQNDLLSKKINKQKMIDQMNKRTNSDPFLEQQTKNQKNEKKDEEL